MADSKIARFEDCQITVRLLSKNKGVIELMMPQQPFDLREDASGMCRGRYIDVNLGGRFVHIRHSTQTFVVQATVQILSEISPDGHVRQLTVRETAQRIV